VRDQVRGPGTLQSLCVRAGVLGRPPREYGLVLLLQGTPLGSVRRVFWGGACDQRFVVVSRADELWAPSWVGSCFGLQDGNTKVVQLKLDDIQKLLPGTKFSCVLSSDGELLVSSHGADRKVIEELLGPISSLKKTAVQFGSTVALNDCSVLHIQVRGRAGLRSAVCVGKERIRERWAR
jgi:hypothetical protein